MNIIILIIIAVITYLFKRIKIHKIIYHIVFVLQVLSLGVYSYRYLREDIKYYKIDQCFYWDMNSLNRITSSYILCKNEQELLKKTLSYTKSNKLKIVSLDKKIDSLNLVIILGESLRRNSMHCYGANVPNTPYIDSLVKIGDMVLFKDVVTSGCNTDLSVKQILSFYDNINNNKKKWFQYPTLFNALKQAGYYTYWASNCENSGVYVNNIMAISDTCDSLRFSSNTNTNDLGSNLKLKYDENVLPLMLKGEDLGKSKFATVIHLMGSHYIYTDRYPKDYDKFKPSDDVNADNRWKVEKALEYSNTILYNDYIIKKIVDYYKDTPSIIFYFSDHGLDLFDDPKNPDSDGHAASIYAAPVPFMVYISPEVRNLGGDYEKIVQQIESAKDRPISLDMVSNSLVNLLGIHTEYDSDKTQCFSPSYIPPKKRGVIGFSNNIELYIDTIHTTPDYWPYKMK